jgi:DMSO/TMAO reductase YedYZ molybdopterin-dependent catalytic subunit
VLPIAGFSASAVGSSMADTRGSQPEYNISRGSARARASPRRMVGLMPLFIVRYEHPADRCPATDPFMGASLLNHLSRARARQEGIDLKGEAVVEGEHTMYLIAEATSEAALRRFMTPFVTAGSVDVYAASSCTRVVARGGCTPATAPADPGVPVVDAEAACEDAIQAGLVVHRAQPLNCETSIPALIGGVVMPEAHFYVRNHFPTPLLDASAWRLEVSGLVERPLSLSLRDLRAMRSQSLVVTLECAGNGRSLLNPRVGGEQWGLGAVSTAEWSGVLLSEVLDRAGVASRAGEVLFRGADAGTVDGSAETAHFERSLSIDDARNADALLAYAMNGEPLPVQHGFPLRVIVPGWYAVTSVKWLTQMQLIEGPFTGPFQGDNYVYEWQRDGQIVQEPVSLQRVRALITEPRPGDVIESGALTVRGVAWSGAAPIAHVEVSVDFGPWQQAWLVGERRRHSWQWWEARLEVDHPGAVSVRARATDMAGSTQPEQPLWNRLGYGNNAIEDVRVSVKRG